MTEECRGEPGKVAPVVDRNRCEGKEDCVRVCPYDVFEIRGARPGRARLALAAGPDQSLGARKSAGVRSSSRRLPRMPEVHRCVPRERAAARAGSPLARRVEQLATGAAQEEQADRRVEEDEEVVHHEAERGHLRLALGEQHHPDRDRGGAHRRRARRRRRRSPARRLASARSSRRRRTGAARACRRSPRRAAPGSAAPRPPHSAADLPRGTP